VEILRLKHYRLLLGSLIEVLPKLVAFLKKTEVGLSNASAPADWRQATAMFDEAIKQGDQPAFPATAYPVTEMQWVCGYDPEAPSNTGKPPSGSHHHLRRKVLGTMIKWCLTIAQKYCHICFLPLWLPNIVTNGRVAKEHMATLDFDHCVPWMKSHSYSSHAYWLDVPRVTQMCTEKKSGCFCHGRCHFRGANME
jgi:hypothetical protein